MKAGVSRQFRWVLALVAALVAMPMAVMASEVVVTSVVDATAPTGSVTLAPGASETITINMTVTGKQDGTATFEVYRDWTLTSGTFAGSNSQEFTVGPRAASDPATTFSTSGTVTVAVGQAPGTFTLAVGAFDITNSNPTGAKLAAGSSSSYSVTVSAPATPANQATTDISLSPSSVNENEPVGTVVGTFSAEDPDVGDSHTFSLVSGAGATTTPPSS